MSGAELGTLECLTERRDVVAMVAVDYRDALQAVADRLPVDEEGRSRLDTLLLVIGQAVEAEAAFRARCAESAALAGQLCPCGHRYHAFDVCGSCSCVDGPAFDAAVGR